jgi:two-component system, NtrC family, response regulator AtoC
MTTAIPLPTPPLRILVAEDEPEIRDYLQLALRRPNTVVDFAGSGEEVLEAMGKDARTPSLVILDLMMPRHGGMSTLQEIRRQDPSVPVIMLSRVCSEIDMAEALREGASHFLSKPVSHDELCQAVEKLLPSTTSSVIPISKRSDTQRAKPDLNLKAGNWIRQVEPLLNRMAHSEVPILLQGETGVGKEVLARYIHDHSPRAGGVFLKLNCAALPSELVESELFGYERGAFTGAFKSNPGKFELANGGTILLDEIGDMDLRLQAKLLQVLQDHEFHRIGAKEATKVDVRVIAATHRELEAQIEDGEFREDLYYRLNVVNIVIPPLRERSDEIVPLASFFLRKHAAPDAYLPEIDAELRSALLRHRWPGNIRELENVMRRYLAIRSSEAIVDELNRLHSKANRGARRAAGRTENDQPQFAAAAAAGAISGQTPMRRSTDRPAPLPAPVPVVAPSGAAESQDGGDSELARLDLARKSAETDVITKALYSTQWNRKRAAALLGVDYKALLYKMKKLGID